MLLLGSMHAEERLAAFLLNLSQRFEARGYSRTEFVLRMTRAEIGSFLGLKLETVSRVLSRFAQDGLIDVNQKHVRIVNPDGLRLIVLARHLGSRPLAPLEGHRRGIHRAFALRAALGPLIGRQRAAVHFERRARQEDRHRARHRADGPEAKKPSV